jgi:hippurate hydrolase
MPVINRVAEWQDELAGWRRSLHERPELGFEEVETSRFVAERLRSFGVDEVHTGIAKTGVVGVVRGRGAGGTIGLRADMDALPMSEETGRPWASRARGRMHACGHDGHTTMLLGAARYLAETRNFDGTVYLIFQPAEEGGGGARVMLNEGLFERFPADQVYGLHNWPWLPTGSFAMRAGPAMAAADHFEIEIIGQGCHAAMPHSGRDPIVTAATLVQVFQSIASREIDPVDNAVISVTKIAGGSTHNVVPERVTMMGTVRTFKPATQDFIERRLGEAARGVAAAHGLEARLHYHRGYPATVNSAREATLAADAAAEIVGEARVTRDPEPAMGAEDFAYMLEKRPGSYIWMGVGGNGNDAPLHSPHYDFNDEALGVGVSYWVRLVERLLPKS